MSSQIAKPDRIGFAITMILFGIAIVSASDLLSKTIIPHVSIWSLLFARSFIGLIILIPLLLLFKKLSSTKALNLKAVLFRSSLMSLCYLCFFLALAKVPIALVAGAFFCAPFFMVLLSRILLGETFGLWRTISLIAGFIGVLFVLQPNSMEFDPLLILALLSSFLYALTQVTTRKYCKNENPIALSYWLAITFMVTGLLGVLALWLMPSLIGEEFLNRPNHIIPASIFILLCVIAVMSIVIHFFISAAYQNAPSSLIAPLEYVYLPLAVIGGYVFYDETPNLMALMGILIIIAAGLIVAWRKGA